MLVLTAGSVCAVDKSILFHRFQEHRTNLSQLRICPVEKEKFVRTTRPDLRMPGEYQSKHKMRAGCKCQVSYSHKMGVQTDGVVLP